MKNFKERIDLLSLTWNGAVFSYCLDEPAYVKVEPVVPRRGPSFKTVEANTIGRICLEKLRPGTHYEIKVRWDRKNRRVSFSTLPAPSGKLLSSFAVLADTHISERGENRKGRLFVESASLLRDVLDECNAQKVDFILIAGDVTNNAEHGEYLLAGKILKQLRCPFFAVPGDHDIRKEDKTKWQKYFGPLQWVKDIKEYRITGLNTSSFFLGKEGAERLRKNVEKPGKTLIILSHLQLLPDKYFTLATKSPFIKDFNEYESLMESVMNRGALIYSGHSNIPSRLALKKGVQISVPQPVQYPCGYFLVRHYENGFYHTFKPVKSEVLREYSRQACNMAVDFYKEPLWRDIYREGKKSNWNFVWREQREE